MAGFHLASLLCLTGGLLISGTMSASVPGINSQMLEEIMRQLGVDGSKYNVDFLSNGRDQHQHHDSPPSPSSELTPTDSPAEVLGPGPSSPARPGCPLGWSRHGDRCFLVVTKKMSMADAEVNCGVLGGNLASIHTSSENYFIKSLIAKAIGSNPTTWIGLFDAIQEGKWMWTDGSKFGYAHWGNGEPNNQGKKEDCTETNFRGDHWNDVPCRLRFPSVCARSP